MKVALDISPLRTRHASEHQVRGSGFYITNLIQSLEKYFPDNRYIYFTNEEGLKEKVDIIHIPYFEPFFLSLPLIKKQKTVVTIHDLIPIVFPNHFASGIRGTAVWHLQKILLRQIDAIMTDSIASQHDISRLTGIPKDRVSVIYLSFAWDFDSGTSESLETVRKKYALPKQFALYVGDVTWNKNLPKILSSVLKINMPLILVGKAIKEADYDKNNPWNEDRVFVQHLLATEKNLQALGFIPTKDLKALYQLATVFVMPSLYEGFGLPILEAMRMGCPVITTKKGSLPEVAGNAAYFVNANSQEEIANAITRIRDDKELRNDLVQKGFKQAENFSWKKTTESVIASYNAVVNA